jgi:hypothetical protein
VDPGSYDENTFAQTSFWDENAFRERLEKRARELGRPLRELLATAGLGHDTLKRDVGARSLRTLAKIARALEWDLAEVMGYPTSINIALSTQAWAGARQVLAKLPYDTATETLRITAHAYIYNLLLARQREGRLPDDPADIVQSYVEGLAAAWAGTGAAAGAAGSGIISRARSRS